MVSFTSEQDYYLYPHPMDMRKDIDGLSDIVRQEMCLDPTRLNGVKCFNTQYLWGIRANKLKLCWFIYDKGSRGRDVIRPYLDKFKGYFTTDGYVVYKLFEKMEDANQIRCACMTHIRRVFVDALHEHQGLISWFINKIKKLFEIEADCKDLHIIGGEERLYERTCRSALIMQQDRLRIAWKEI